MKFEVPMGPYNGIFVKGGVTSKKLKICYVFEMLVILLASDEFSSF